MLKADALRSPRGFCYKLTIGCLFSSMKMFAAPIYSTHLICCLNGNIWYADYISMHFNAYCALETFNPDLACSYTINITMQFLNLLLGHSHAVFRKFRLVGLVCY